MVLAMVSNGPGPNAGRACPARGAARPSGLCGTELCCGVCSGTSAAAAWMLPSYVPLPGTNTSVGKQQGSDTCVSWHSLRTYTASFCNVIGVFFFFLATAKLPLLEGTSRHLHLS